MGSHKLTGAILVLLLAVGVYVTQALTAQPRTPTETWTVGRMTLEDVVRLQGIVWPKQRSVVWPSRPGKVAGVSVRRGEYVHKGRELYALAPERTPGELRRATLEWKKARLRYLSLGEERNNRFSNDVELELARVEFDLATLDYETKRERSEATVVRADAPGRVVSVNVSVGDFLSGPMSGSAPPVVIGNEGACLAQAETDDGRVADLPAGSEGTVRLGDGSLRTGRLATEATLRRLSAGLGGQATFVVEVDFDCSGLTPYASLANIELRRVLKRDALVVPLSVLETGASGSVAIVQRGGKSVRQAIQVGALSGDFVEAVSGVREGERVIVNRTNRARN